MDGGAGGSRRGEERVEMMRPASGDRSSLMFPNLISGVKTAI